MDDASEALIAEATSRCNSEPIHLSGAIQDFGCLIAADPTFRKIRSVSANLGLHLGVDPFTALGAPVETLLPRRICHAARNAIARADSATHRAPIGRAEFPSGDFEASAFRTADAAVVELLPASTAPATESFAAIESLRTALARFASSTDPQIILEETVPRLRAIAKVDRVMAYRLLPSGAGEVVAEDRAADVGGYLGLRFPATDIPAQARALYARTPIRIIADLSAADAPLLASDPTAAPLDLSLSILRSCAEVHKIYLGHMGVSASLTLPIALDGALWGLFAFHHRAPMEVDPARAMTLELAGQIIGLKIANALTTARQKTLRGSLAVARALARAGLSAGRSGEWPAARRRAAEALRSDDAILIGGGAAAQSAIDLGADAIAALGRLAAAAPTGVSHFERLSEAAPGVDFGPFAGAAILSFDRRPATALIALRRAAARTITWAGAPEKDVDVTASGPRLSPRSSFVTYLETVEDASDEWTAADLDAASALFETLDAAIETRAAVLEENDPRRRATGEERDRR